MQALAGSASLQVCAPPKALSQRDAPTASVSAARPATLSVRDPRAWRLSSAAASSDAAACFRGSDFFDNALSTLVPRAARGSGSGARRGVVEMSTEALSRAYAAAVLEVGQVRDCLEVIHSDMEKLQGVCKDKGMNDFLCNPVMGLEKKKAVLNMVADDLQLHPYTKSFMSLLVDQKRPQLLAEVGEEFEQLYCEAVGMEVAEVTSAIKLNNSQQALIAKKLQELTGAKKIKLKSAVDPSLIAGFKLKFGKGGSMLVDLSVKGQLASMESQFAVST